MASRLRALHCNIDPRAAAPVKMMRAAAADARVHQQRIAGPANTSLRTALDRFLELNKQRPLPQRCNVSRRCGLSHL
jgi:hypothetical protein